MGKKRKHQHATAPPPKKPRTEEDLKHQPAPKKPKPSSQQTQQHTAPTIPFSVYDHILILGDGDLSFSRSCVESHGCADLTATTYDTLPVLLEKYPQAGEAIEYLEGEGQMVLHGIDATKLGQYKELRRGGLWDRVFFNFPHVGGKSRDVNRQVRYNQEMLVSFFRAALPLLSPQGTIIITLFEGEPYTLWNIRDLARHAGLSVQRSFKFQADAYPGYAHKRTLGNIDGGGGWKGEDRLSRSYIFGLKGAEEEGEGRGMSKRQAAHERKRKRKEDDSSGDD